MSEFDIKITRKRGGREQIQTAMVEYQGKLYIDIRNHYKDKSDSTFKPSPKGIMIPLHNSRSVSKQLRVLIKQIEESGKYDEDIDDTEFEKETPVKKSKRKDSESEIDEKPAKKKKRAPVEEDEEEEEEEEEIKPRRRGEIDEEDRPKKKKKESDFPAEEVRKKKKKKK